MLQCLNSRPGYLTAVQLQWEWDVSPAQSEWAECQGKETNELPSVCTEKSFKDLNVNYCPSMVKFRTVTEKMQKTFFLATTLTTLSAKRGMLFRLLGAVTTGRVCRPRSESLLSSCKPQGNLGSLQWHCSLQFHVAGLRLHECSSVNALLLRLSAHRRFKRMVWRKFVCWERHHEGGTPRELIFLYVSLQWRFHVKLQGAIFAPTAYWFSIRQTTSLSTLVSHFTEKTTSMFFSLR